MSLSRFQRWKSFRVKDKKAEEAEYNGAIETVASAENSPEVVFLTKHVQVSFFFLYDRSVLS